MDAFNAGFQAYGQGDRACPAHVAQKEAQLAKDGYLFTKRMVSRYRPDSGQVITKPAK